MNYQDLHNAVQSQAGLRLRLRLQPLYGQGEVIFPCTVAGGKYQISDRRIPGYETSVKCAVVDSVQSQANRMEDVLLSDITAGKIHLPHVATDFSFVENLEKPIGVITCFEAPHRIFDAIIRDSVDASQKHFPLTDLGMAVVNANAKDAKAIFQVSPASLLFGSWDSTGISGGLGEKYTRCVVSELIAIRCDELSRDGFRIDPLNISSGIDCSKIASQEKDQLWSERQAKTKKDKQKAAAINHGNILIGNSHGGITCDYVQQSTTISFAALRQLNFPVGEEDQSPFAHAVLAAIALHAAALNVERGWHLRSRCDLAMEEGQSAIWEILGNSPTKEELKADATRELLEEAIAKAKEAGLPWNEAPLKLTPSKALASLVVKSQQAHRTAAPTEA